MQPRPPCALARFQSFLLGYTDLDPASAAPLLVSFARGEATVCPPISGSLAVDEVWLAHEDRAQIIAEFGLLHSSEEAEAAHRAASATLIAERRNALNENWLAWGFEVQADTFAADLTISLAEARARIFALRAQSTVAAMQRLDQTARAQVEFGPNPHSPQEKREQSATSMNSALDDAIAGRKAGVKNA